MDSNALAPLIPVVAILAYAGVRIAKIWAQGRPTLSAPATDARLAALEEDITELKRQLEETHERLDFTERLLAQQRTERVNPPA